MRGLASVVCRLSGSVTAARGVGGRRSGTDGMLAVGLVDDWSSSRGG